MTKPIKENHLNKISYPLTNWGGYNDSNDYQGEISPQAKMKEKKRGKK